jgi:hypothetical protein
VGELLAGKPAGCPWVRMVSKLMSKRNRLVRRSSCSSAAVSRSNSKLARPASWKFSDTFWLRGLNRLLPLP